MERRKKTKLTATQSLVLGVIVVIFIGAIILKLPISNNEGRSIKFLDSLFVSTSCVCVTGLTTVVPSEQFSKFGQIVLMCLIEIGGLGFMSFIALILMFMGRKINLSDRMLIKESLNQNNVGGFIYNNISNCWNVITFYKVYTKIWSRRRFVLFCFSFNFSIL